jgi:hypothetical protein
MTDAPMNCDCESESPYRTIAELTRDMMIGLGYAAQASNPPPGMSEEILYHLQRAQAQLIKKNPDLRTKRFFKWTTVADTRYYDLSANETTCGLALRPEGIEWVGWEDSNGNWQELIHGIRPAFYTSVSQNGNPSHYEVRSCLEVFPAPSTSGWKLWVKGEFAQTAFDNPEHKPIIDDEAVLLLALAMAKGRRNHRDKNDAYAQASNYLRDLKAGKHGTRRYIPNTKLPPPMTPPRMESFDG